MPSGTRQLFGGNQSLVKERGVEYVCGIGGWSSNPPKKRSVPARAEGVA
jgi:hypothetical protein